MKTRAIFAVLLLVCMPLTGHAATKKKPLAVEVSASSDGLPLVTLTASDAPLGEVAKRLAAKLGTAVDVSPAARNLRVTTALDRQTLDLALRQIAPQAYLDGILTGGSGQFEVLSIHLATADEAAPALKELAKSSSEAVLFSGNTEDPGMDPLEGRLDVTYQNERLRVSAKQQPLSAVVARIASALGIPFEMIDDSRKMVDVEITGATLEQAMRALTPSVKLYHRKDLTTFRVTPVRLVVQATGGGT